MSKRKLFILAPCESIVLNDLKLTILERLYRAGYIGGRHTGIENAAKSLPKHEAGGAKQAVKELIKEGYIVPKPTSYGMHIALNPKRIAEIRKLIGEG